MFQFGGSSAPEAGKAVEVKQEQPKEDKKKAKKEEPKVEQEEEAGMGDLFG